MKVPQHAIFITYRRRDSIYAVDRLDERLKQAFGAHAVFRDVRSIRKGHSFPDDIRGALGEATLGLVIIGPWWLHTGDDEKDRSGHRRLDDPKDWVRIEVETLLQRKLPSGQPIPVIPVLIGGADMPKPDDLPDPLKQLAQRDGLQLRPEPDFEDSARQLIEHVGRILGVEPQPLAPRGHGHAEPPPRISSTRLSVTGKKFVGREQELHLLDEAWGRSADDKINVISFIGQGGEGKTAAVLEWYSRRAHHGWQGARRVFDWSFYSQGSSAQSAASADEFFSKAFEWFGYTGEVPKDPRDKGAKLGDLICAERTLLVLDGLEPLQHPPGGFGGEFKDPAMKALLRRLAQHNPGLCILTSRQDIVDLASFEHADGSCLRHPLHALDVATARELLRELGVRGPDKELDEAISWFHRHAYDLNLLGNFLGQCTTDRDIRGWRDRFPILQEDENIHPVPDAAGKRAGHGRRMLRAYVRWLGPGSPAVAVLRLLGLFDRPARSDLLDELRAQPAIPGLTDALVALPDAEWLRTLDQLQQLALITREPYVLPPESAPASEAASTSPDTVPDEVLDALLQHPNFPAEMKKLPRARLMQIAAQAMGKNSNVANKGTPAKRPRRPVSFTVDAHPLLREHFAAELREHLDMWRAAHRRLYDYLCDTTPDKSQPTLDDLQPLYQAVAHGCQAGLQQVSCDEVYVARINHGTGDEGFYATRKLGAFGSDLGAVACFFEQPWSRISNALTEPARSFLLNQAGFRLRALGRLAEALEPIRVSGEMDVKVREWVGAAISYGNLSELELTLGEVAGALGNAELSVTYADRSGIASQRMGKRTTHADALHQAGRRAEADTRFRESEQMQKERQPTYPLLYSLPGFRYCDLLLAASERAAWGEMQHLDCRVKKEELVGACRAVFQRAAQTLEWEEGMSGAPLLDIALHHLTLGRAALYELILEHLSFVTCHSSLENAVSGIRRAGTTHHLPSGLLTRAWLRFLDGKLTGPESAQADLDEAWEIAERGPMRLFMADIHLYRARLYFREEKYPWKSPKADLESAEKLINDCGYHRRDEELADAKRAILRGSAE